jgi:hypothetical protein
LALSVSSAWAMDVGLTGGAHGAGDLSRPQARPPVGDALLVGDARRAGAVGDLVGDDALTLRRFQEASKVLKITVEGLDGPIDVYCATTTERAPVDAVSVQADQLMDVFHELCSPQPSAS